MCVVILAHAHDSVVTKKVGVLNFARYYERRCHAQFLICVAISARLISASAPPPKSERCSWLGTTDAQDSRKVESKTLFAFSQLRYAWTTSLVCFGAEGGGRAETSHYLRSPRFGLGN